MASSPALLGTSENGRRPIAPALAPLGVTRRIVRARSSPDRSSDRERPRGGFTPCPPADEAELVRIVAGSIGARGLSHRILSPGLRRRYRRSLDQPPSTTGRSAPSRGPERLVSRSSAALSWRSILETAGRLHGRGGPVGCPSFCPTATSYHGTVAECDRSPSNRSSAPRRSWRAWEAIGVRT